MQITLNIPEQYFIDASPLELSRRIKLYAALVMFQSGQLSAGAAAEFAEADRLNFMIECGRHGIPVVDYAPDELESELASLQQAF